MVLFHEHKGVTMASEEVKKLLEQGFLAEAQASNLYYFFARKADEEVSSAQSAEIANLLRQAAMAFRQAADEEVLHAFIHLSAIDGIGNTLQNLQTASSMEAFEYQTVFPSSAEALQTDGNTRVAGQMEAIRLTEKHHTELFDRLAELLTNTSLGKPSPAAARP
jgi:rubrerythrin